jgi:hypothetical protein
MADASHRGVIVAPPSGNTSPPESYVVVHRGFDTLALSIKANIPHGLLDYLDAELKVAADERREVLITYAGLNFQLLPHGGSGYRFILKGGLGSSFKCNTQSPLGIGCCDGHTKQAPQQRGPWGDISRV